MGFGVQSWRPRNDGKETPRINLGAKYKIDSGLGGMDKMVIDKGVLIINN